MQNIFFIVGINHNETTPRLIMVAQEPSLNKINYLRADFLVPVLSANTQPPNQHSRIITPLLDPRNKFHKSPLGIIRQLRNSNRRIRQRIFLESNESGLFQNQISLTNLFGKVLLSAHLCSAFGRQSERKGFLPLQGRYRPDFKCHSLNIELTQPKCNNTRDRTP